MRRTRCPPRTRGFAFRRRALSFGELHPPSAPPPPWPPLFERPHGGPHVHIDRRRDGEGGAASAVWPDLPRHDAMTWGRAPPRRAPSAACSDGERGRGGGTGGDRVAQSPGLTRDPTAVGAVCGRNGSGDQFSVKSEGGYGVLRITSASPAAEGGGGGYIATERTPSCCCFGIAESLNQSLLPPESLSHCAAIPRGGVYPPPPLQSLGQSLLRPSVNHKSPRRGLLDQAQVRTPYTPLFWGHSRTIPQGMVPDVQPLVKSSF